MLRRLLIAEDHPICCTALELAAHARDSAILVESCDSLADAMRLLSARDYDALVLDLGLKDSQGTINLKTVRDRHPQLPVLVVSATDDNATQFRSRSFGAQGFLSKTASLEEMGEAILTIMDGGTHFTDLAEEDEPDEESLLESLSPAQTRILKELLAGHSNKVIAFNLGLSEATVKSHLNAIFRIFGVSNRSQVIIKLGRLT